MRGTEGFFENSPGCGTVGGSREDSSFNLLVIKRILRIRDVLPREARTGFGKERHSLFLELRSLAIQACPR